MTHAPDDRRYMTYEQRAATDSRYVVKAERHPETVTCFCGKTVYFYGTTRVSAACPRNCDAQSLSAVHEGGNEMTYEEAYETFMDSDTMSILLRSEAQGWLEDCFTDLPLDITLAEIIEGINRHYAGGLVAFVAASA